MIEITGVYRIDINLIQYTAWVGNVYIALIIAQHIQTDMQQNRAADWVQH